MPSQIAEEPTVERRNVWAFPSRVAFRFFFLYWLLCIIPSAGAVSVFDLLPFGGIGNALNKGFAWPLARLAHLAGVHVFHLSGEGADWHPTTELTAAVE